MTREEIFDELKTTFIDGQSKSSHEAISYRNKLLKQLYPHAWDHNARIRLMDSNFPDWRGYRPKYLQP